jgi:hypothetical protein
MINSNVTTKIISLFLINLQRSEIKGKPNWPPMLGYMDKGVVWRIPSEEMNQTYLTNPRAYYCPMYFYDGTNPYPETYMHGAGYFLPWWAVPCVYQQSFQVNFDLSSKQTYVLLYCFLSK